jgi:hypothetical protein
VISSALSLIRLTIRRPSEGQSPKDDLESLLYAIVWLVKGTLPWAACNKMKEIREHKSITKGLDLCEGFPEVFGKFFDYIRGLKHGEQPDYHQWKKMFQDLLEVGDAILNRIPRPTALAFPHQSTDHSEHAVDDAEDDDDFLPYLSWALPHEALRPETLSTMMKGEFLHIIEFAGLLAPPSH